MQSRTYARSVTPSSSAGFHTSRVTSIRDKQEINEVIYIDTDSDSDESTVSFQTAIDLRSPSPDPQDPTPLRTVRDKRVERELISRGIGKKRVYEVEDSSDSCSSQTTNARASTRPGKKKREAFAFSTSAKYADRSSSPPTSDEDDFQPDRRIRYETEELAGIETFSSPLLSFAMPSGLSPPRPMLRCFDDLYDNASSSILMDEDASNVDDIDMEARPVDTAARFRSHTKENPSVSDADVRTSGSGRMPPSTPPDIPSPLGISISSDRHSSPRQQSRSFRRHIPSTPPLPPSPPVPVRSVPDTPPSPLASRRLAAAVCLPLPESVPPNRGKASVSSNNVLPGLLPQRPPIARSTDGPDRPVSFPAGASPAIASGSSRVDIIRQRVNELRFGPTGSSSPPQNWWQDGTEEAMPTMSSSNQRIANEPILVERGLNVDDTHSTADKAGVTVFTTLGKLCTGDDGADAEASGSSAAGATLLERMGGRARSPMPPRRSLSASARPRCSPGDNSDGMQDTDSTVCHHGPGLDSEGTNSGGSDGADCNERFDQLVSDFVIDAIHLLSAEMKRIDSSCLKDHKIAFVPGRPHFLRDLKRLVVDLGGRVLSPDSGAMRGSPAVNEKRYLVALGQSGPDMADTYSRMEPTMRFGLVELLTTISEAMRQERENNRRGEARSPKSLLERMGRETEGQNISAAGAPRAEGPGLEGPKQVTKGKVTLRERMAAT